MTILPLSPGRLDLTKLAAARMKLIHPGTEYGMPYFAQAVFALIVVECPELPTLAVDEGWRLYCNPDFVDRLSVDELAGGLAHEIGHLVRDSAGRGKAIGVAMHAQKRWNIACDLAINSDLREAEVPLPARVLFPETFGLEPGLLAEEYFALLEVHDPNAGGSAPGLAEGSSPSAGGGPADPLRPGEGADCGSCAGGEARPWEQGGPGGEGPDAFDEVAGRIDDASADLIRRAVARDVLAAGKQAGKVPAGMARWADGLLHPVVDWRRVLSGFVTAACQYVSGQHDYSYHRPSRRGAPGGVILPSMRRPVPTVAIVVDTSGSMSARELKRCIGEVEGIIKAAGVSSEGLRVLSCDAAVHTVERVTSARSVSLIGGGGTDMGAGIAAAMALRPRPGIVVVLTDGCTPWPSTRPRSRVIVGIIGAEKVEGPPWASTVHIPLKSLK